MRSGWDYTSIMKSDKVGVKITTVDDFKWAIIEDTHQLRKWEMVEILHHHEELVAIKSDDTH